MGIIHVGLITTDLVFKLFGLTLERPTSWTLEQLTPHLPSSPHSNLKDISKLRLASAFSAVRSNAFYHRRYIRRNPISFFLIPSFAQASYNFNFNDKSPSLCLWDKNKGTLSSLRSLLFSSLTPSTSNQPKIAYTYSSFP